MDPIGSAGTSGITAATPLRVFLSHTSELGKPGEAGPCVAAGVQAVLRARHGPRCCSRSDPPRRPASGPASAGAARSDQKPLMWMKLSGQVTAKGALPLEVSMTVEFLGM